MRASLLILDKSASTKYSLNFNDTISFRDITFELVACEESVFDKYIDTIFKYFTVNTKTFQNCIKIDSFFNTKIKYQPFIFVWLKQRLLDTLYFQFQAFEIIGA